MRRLLVIATAFLPASVMAQNGDLQPALTTAHPICANGCLNPIEAVTFASYLGNRAGVAGEFSMTVKNVGFRDDRFYLNSEQDYRDRNCLTVVIPQEVMRQIARTTDPDAIRNRFQAKQIVVKGIARQVRIDFTAGGKPTGKYYFQVHIQIGQKYQVAFLPV